MNKTIRLWLVTLGLGWAVWSGPASAHELVPPFKVRVHFGIDVQCLNQPCPSAPWWAYFPQPEHHEPARPVFPNWPVPFPQPDDGMTRRPGTYPATVASFTPWPVRTVGWRPDVAPAYWFGR